MIENEIAKKYSVALFDLGKENSSLIQYRDELESFVKTLNDNTDLKKFLSHPRVRVEDKKKTVDDIFTKSLSKNISNFIKLLIDRRREMYIDLIYKNFFNLVNKEKDIIEVEVISAIELNKKLKDSLQSKLNKLLDKKEIIIKEKVDPDIIAGMIVKIGDKVIDGSFRNKLDSLKNNIMQIPVSELGV
ncbi:ATP synthase F1 subunit delta [Natronospora cellulosivora (SeqCode)]